MQETLQALGGILLKAIPTVILLIILHFYLKAVLFGPLDRMMQKRRELTEGARKIAEDSLAAAARKADEYEAKLRDARAVGLQATGRDPEALAGGAGSTGGGSADSQ